MNEERRFALGLLAFITLALFITYNLIFISLLNQFEHPSTHFRLRHLNHPGEFFGQFRTRFIAFLVFMMLYSTLTLVGQILYMIHIFKDQRPMSGGQRIAWIILLILGGPVGLLIYFFVRIRTDLPPPSPPTERRVIPLRQTGIRKSGPGS
jgi:amino acid transporter